MIVHNLSTNLVIHLFVNQIIIMPIRLINLNWFINI